VSGTRCCSVPTTCMHRQRSSLKARRSDSIARAGHGQERPRIGEQLWRHVLEWRMDVTSSWHLKESALGELGKEIIMSRDGGDISTYR
jgi:hypothetical protein